MWYKAFVGGSNAMKELAPPVIAIGLHKHVIFKNSQPERILVVTLGTKELAKKSKRSITSLLSRAIYTGREVTKRDKLVYFFGLRGGGTSLFSGFGELSLVGASL